MVVIDEFRLLIHFHGNNKRFSKTRINVCLYYFLKLLSFFLKFAFGVAKLMIDDPLMGFGLLVIGVCPGGIASNFWTLLLDGDVNLNITMTFVSSIAAMGQYSTFLFDRQNQD